MNKYIIALLIIVLAIVGIVAFTGGDEGAENPDENATTTQQARLELEGSNTYTADPARSELAWTGSKTLVANYEDSGTVDLADGALVVEDGEIVSGEFTIDTTTIVGEETSNEEMGVDRLTQHLRSEDFFDVENYPTATFAITDVAAADEPHTYNVTGDLTIKGTTNEVTFPAEIYLDDAGNLVADATIEIDRTLYDVRFGSDRFFDNLGDNVIDDTFVLDVYLVATPDEDSGDDSGAANPENETGENGQTE